MAQRELLGLARHEHGAGAHVRASRSQGPRQITDLVHVEPAPADRFRKRGDERRESVALTPRMDEEAWKVSVGHGDWLCWVRVVAGVQR